MDPKHCHHCDYEWTPRKENPKKCPQCQNSLWRSAKPKKPRTAAQVFMNEAVEDLNAGIPFDAPNPPHVWPVYGGIERGSMPVDEPSTTPSFAEQRRKAEELLRKLA